MSDPTDQELFNSAVSNEPVADTPPEPAEQPVEQPAPPRDEQGRFAARQEDAPPEIQAAEQAAKPEPAIPPSRLREEAEARRRAETRVAELERLLLQPTQRQPEPVNPEPVDPMMALLEDPQAWLKSQLNPLSEELYTTRKSFSERLAIQTHGFDKVKAAYDALEQAVASGAMRRDAVEAELRKSPDPAAEIMGWYEKTEPQRDPEAFKQRIIQEYLASQNQQPAPAAQAQAPGSTVVRLPQSLNRATAAASSNAAGGDDVSDAALFQQTTTRRR